MARRQYLKRGDPRHDIDGEGDGLLQPLRNTQGAVIQRRIPPDEEADTAALGQGALHLGQPDLCNGIMPIVDARVIIRVGGVAFGQGEFVNFRPVRPQHLGANLVP